MRIGKSLFLTTVFIGCFLTVVDANAKKDTCKTGEFLFNTSCYWCRVGCYCPGGNKETLSLDPKNEFKIDSVEAYCSRKKNECPHKGSDGYGECGRQAEAQMYRCPPEFPITDGSATSGEKCYNWGYPYKGAPSKNAKCWHQLVMVKPGEYLPGETCAPAKCPAGKVCKGSVKHGNTNGTMPRFGDYKSDWGAYDCAKGTIPNADQSDCVSAEIECPAGKYVPAGKFDCQTCKSDSYCPGGKFQRNPSSNKGLFTCEFGMVPNKTKTGCEKEKPKMVQPGYYLPGGEKTEKPCKTDKNKNYYCPGGLFYYSKQNHGIYECPNGSTPNDRKNACKKKVDKTAMKKCFFEVDDINKYKNCLTGSRYYK